MPIHDWTRVDAGIFHDFHSRWITHISESLNSGLLPEGFYALAEQHSGNIIPDVVALRSPDASLTGHGGDPVAIATAETPPKVSVTARPESNTYAILRRTLAIRHVSDDRVVGLIEIVSRANKDRASHVNDFAAKVVGALRERIHVLVVDLILPGAHDPLGMHGATWNLLDESNPYGFTSEKPLTLAAYCATEVPTAYIEPLAMESELPPMPMFLDPDWYVNVPLAETYEAAYRGVPQRWKEVIEA